MLILIITFVVLTPAICIADTTIVFALVGTNFWKFLAALIITLIQPFSNVYLGVAAIQIEGMCFSFQLQRTS